MLYSISIFAAIIIKLLLKMSFITIRRRLISYPVQILQNRVRPYEQQRLVEEDEDCGQERIRPELGDIPLEEADYNYFATENENRHLGFLENNLDMKVLAGTAQVLQGPRSQSITFYHSANLLFSISYVGHPNSFLNTIKSIPGSSFIFQNFPCFGAFLKQKHRNGIVFILFFNFGCL